MPNEVVAKVSRQTVPTISDYQMGIHETFTGNSLEGATHATIRLLITEDH